jgi:hypothetical protein
VIQNEQGMNWEFGAKVSKFDGKLVGTLSFFRGERENQMLDDGAKQSNLEEPLNYSTTLFPVGSPYRNTRLLRWRTTDLMNRVEGTEAEVIWSPIRNYQAVINGSWLRTAKTVYDKTRAAPGTAAYNASTAAAKVASDIYYNARIENVPEFRFNIFNKYTFVDGVVNGNILQDDEHEATVAIAKGATVTGDIRAKHVIVSGTLRGNIFSSDRV